MVCKTRKSQRKLDSFQYQQILINLSYYITYLISIGAILTLSDLQDFINTYYSYFHRIFKFNASYEDKLKKYIQTNIITPFAYYLKEKIK